jgi:DNA-binding LacI/PurR family transcriptional regulator
MKRNIKSLPGDAHAWRKQEPLGDALLALAQELGPNAKLPTVRELCRTFGVSTSTLDPVLRTLELRGAIVREHGRGIFVAAGIRQKTIGVVFGDDIYAVRFSPFLSLLLQEVRSQVVNHVFRLQAYLDISSKDDCGFGYHHQLIEDLEGKRLDGILLFESREGQIPGLRASGVPLVVFGDESADWVVTHHNDYVFRLVAKVLAPAPCKRIGFLSSPDYRPVLERELLKAAMPSVQLDDWSYETWSGLLPESGTRENCARLMAQRLIAGAGQKPLPEVVVSTDDTATCGLIAALLQAGVYPGRDVRIITTGNKGSPVLCSHRNLVTLIEFDPAASVAAMLEMLETLIRGGRPAHSRVLIAPKLV